VRGYRKLAFLAIWQLSPKSPEPLMHPPSAPYAGRNPRSNPRVSRRRLLAVAGWGGAIAVTGGPWGMGSASAAAPATSPSQASASTGDFVVALPSGVAATDQAALQEVLTLVGQAGYGRITVPGGLYRLNGAPKWPSHLNWTLEGAGSGATTFQFESTSDLGPTVGFNIPGGPDECALKGFRLKGPSQGGGVLNSNPAQMSGVRLGSKVKLDDVVVSGFLSGIQIYGDHQRLSAVRSVSNKFNLHYVGGAPTCGNQSFDRFCDFGGATLASIRIDSDATMEGVVGVLHTGFAPFAVFRDPSGAVTKPLFNGSRLYMPMESCGNACIYSPNDGSGIIPTGRTTLESSDVSFGNPTYRLRPGTVAPDDSDFTINMSTLEQLTLQGGFPGSSGIKGFCFGKWRLDGFRWMDIPQSALDNASFGPQILATKTNSTCINVYGESDGGTRRYIFRGANGPQTRGSVVCTPGGDNSFQNVGACFPSAPDRQVVGVARNSAAAGALFAVQVAGQALVACANASSIGAGGTPLKAAITQTATSGSGCAVQASVSDPGVIGYALGSPLNGFVSAMVKLG